MKLRHAKLSEVCRIRPSKAEAVSRLSPTHSVSFVPMEDLGINKKWVEPTQTRTLNEVRSGYTFFQDGDVLLAKITPCFENGKLGIARDLVGGIGFGSTEFIVFRPNETLDSQYLYYFLARPRFRREGAKHMAGAVGHKRVSKDFIDSYIIPLPPIEIQREIVGELEATLDLVSEGKESLEKQAELYEELEEVALESAFRKSSGK